MEKIPSITSGHIVITLVSLALDFLSLQVQAKA